ncbi:MAG: ATP-binding cassette domain-containing protein [Candidatus Leucobacter sulfamidivorax]|nr:ATP-binding cassette domain-containing protein [Candidatus Leucobacter sulfamidivorax]
MSVPLLETRSLLDAHVVVHRGGFTVDVRMELAPGETLAIMGPSGAGKTTVLDAISGVVRLDAGRIALAGAVVADAASRTHVAPNRRSVGVLGQEALLFPHLSAERNIAFAARAAGETAADARAEAHDWLARVGLGDLAKRMPAELSGGQRQRVALARALAARPSLLLLDEPLVALDVEAAADTRELLRQQLAASGTAAVVVSHDGFDAVELADRLLVIENGGISQQGPVAEVLASPATRFVSAVAARC